MFSDLFLSDTGLFRCFQAMECGLIGISTWKDHSSDILKEINNFSRVNETLYAYSHREGSKSERTGGIKYKLNLLNSNGKSLNKYILDNDLACAMEGEEEFVKDVPIVMQKCEDVDAGTFEILNEDDLQNPQITQNNSEFLSTEVEVPKGLGSHFSLMTDSLFENESELTFLKQVILFYYSILTNFRYIMIVTPVPPRRDVLFLKLPITQKF